MHLKEVDANLLVILDALLMDASVTRAAERLGRSASAISHALAKLREIFGDELFVRAGQRLVPTAKAQELAPTVHVILAGMESLLRPDNPFDPSLAERDFSISASEAAELVVVQPLRKHLANAAPSVRVGWIPGAGEDSIEALRNTRCHFAIDIESTQIPAPDIRSAKLFDDHLVVLGRPGHPLSVIRPDAHTLAEATHVAVEALPAFALLERRYAEEGFICRAPEHVSSVLVGLLLTLNSDALMTVPTALAQILEKQFSLVRVAQPLGPIAFPVRLLWHSSYDRDECHQWVRGEIAGLAAGRAIET
ncbi:LysR family transcriptional regulator [Methyloligella sp. 2.7D]|uniref:LysR family transcriptional regulator n=1 Tax=unclassified Methyloligella TaxID=2625955 RepID=UPI00157E277A|nr:LysR family transcriptional regulator [Methyloligella sp. GL2]QKP78597.1 LysR family transcriptional regulator [Methyloligella sp. GL2]